jgi:hypothetical protein
MKEKPSEPRNILKLGIYDWENVGKKNMSFTALFHYFILEKLLPTLSNVFFFFHLILTGKSENIRNKRTCSHCKCTK